MNLRQLYFTVVAVIAIDQLTKFFLFSSEMTLNTGVSFSLLSFFPQWALVLVLWGVLLVVWRWDKELWVRNQIATGMFFGAAVSNLLDRVLYGGVRDFLPVPLLGVENNLADYSLTIGLLLILFKEFRRQHE